MKLKDLCNDEMPREKLLNNGAETLSNTELLAILLRTGRGGANVIDVAREMLTTGDGTLSDLAMMSVNNLCKIRGIGPGKAVTVAAAFELGRRASIEMNSGAKIPMSSPSTVYKVMLPIFRHLDHEECWILHLNKSNRLIQIMDRRFLRLHTGSFHDGIGCRQRCRLRLGCFNLLQGRQFI